MAFIKCPQCGAKPEIPATGLMMRCGYCGLEMMVPDADARRAAMERTAEREAREAERARQRAEAQAQREAEQQRKREEQARGRRAKHVKKILGLPSKLFALLFSLIPLAIVGYVLYINGVLDGFVGEPGRAAFDDTAQTLESEGYTRITEPRVASGVLDREPRYFELDKGLCYAVVVGAGKPIRVASVTDPRGAKLVEDKTLGFDATLRLCALESGAYKADITLDAMGRYTWAVYKLAPASSAKPKKKRKKKAASGS
jgi:hypothetical protein